ncbi:MAG: quinolinate synthase NadA [Endomicrobium sp.]|nr:quinolinate synthase NadA [Endomicrobium sp.]
MYFCASSSSVYIVKSIKSDGENNFLSPDRNLCRNVQKNRVENQEYGIDFCPTHNNFVLPDC